MDNNVKYSFKICSLPKNELVFENALFINPKDYETIKSASNAKTCVHVSIKNSIMHLKAHENVPLGSMGIGKLFRECMSISETLGAIDVSYAFDMPPPNKRIGRVKYDIVLKSKSSSLGMNEVQELDAQDLKELLRNYHLNTVLNKNHIYYMTMNGAVLIIRVKDLEPEELVSQLEKIKSLDIGFLHKDTEMIFEVNPDYKKSLKIKGQITEGKAIFVRNFEGVGGLNKELDDIFRIAFASRRYPASYLEKYGITHVKGMLLHGPPGTGKTLIARTLANALNAAECKIVNGPELFDKYVGETEKKIRDLFSKAEEDQQMNGDESGLHVIVFDEMDSICKARGSITSGTGVNDNAVNQLLAKIDGVDSLNNILIIGMTNRKDLMDDAILRPGRLELHVEIGLPNEEGRLEILKIHTKKMTENSLLENDVDLKEIAQMTKNYTGAEIESLVKRASTFALNKGIDLKSNKVDVTKFNKIGMVDFISAFNEIKPQFGTDNQNLSNCLQLGFINYGPQFDSICTELKGFINQMRNSKFSLQSILLHGQTGTGKTALACSMALESGFPYVKLISPETLVGFSENGKVGAITKIFEDAYKSPLSLVILDNIERLIEYVNVGPRFSNLVLQTLLVYIKKLPQNKNRKIMIMGTTSNPDRLDYLEIISTFNVKIEVKPINSKNDVLTVLNSVTCKEGDTERIAQFAGEIPVKQLLLILDMAKEEGSGEVSYESFSAAYKYFF